MERAIARMSQSICDLLEGSMQALYLYGSVTMDDFQPGWSDIDLVCFASSALAEEQAQKLLTLRQQLLQQEPGNPYYRSFEGVIVSLAEFLSGHFTRVVYWGTSGQRILSSCPFDAFARYELLNTGRLVAGEDIRDQLTPPTYSQLRQEIIRHDRAIRSYAVQTDETLYSCGWLLDIARGIYTLRTGEVITTLDRSETDGQELANLMIGRELAPSHYGKVEEPGDPVIQMRSVDYHKESKHAGLSGVSLTVGRGEIVGIAGVDGNGQSQLAQVVTGVLTPDGGEVDMKGSKVAQFTPNGFILENVSHIPEDRNKMGLIGNMSVKDNIVLKATDSPEFSSAKGYFLKKKAIRDYALKMQEKYDIRCTSVEQETRNLSGGNQQKVILARELEGSPDLLVAVHPTRGLDIGATRFVHDTMIEARDKGCGVLLISADFDEILEVSDRIVVMFEGQIMGVFSGKNPPIEEISLAMAGK